MLIVTCDDGIKSEGYLALLEALMTHLREELLIIAPEEQSSAMSHCLTFFKPIFLSKTEMFGQTGYIVDGTPADAVLVALFHILPEPRSDDIIVVSGINRGANLGYDIHYSGTVAAAMEGVIHGHWGIAISVAEYENPDYRYAKLVAVATVLALRELARSEPSFQTLRGEMVLNINVPNTLPQKPQFTLTCQGKSRYIGRLYARYTPGGRKYLWIGGDYPRGEPEVYTDFWAISNQMVSFTPIGVNLTWAGYRIYNPELEGDKRELDKKIDLIREWVKRAEEIFLKLVKKL